MMLNEMILNPPPALSVLCPPYISAGHSRSAKKPLLVKLPKSRITAHLHAFIPFSHLLNKRQHSLLSHFSLQVFKIAVHHHLISSPIQNRDLYDPRQTAPNPPPSNFLFSFLKLPVVPSCLPCVPHPTPLPSTDLLLSLFPTFLCFPLPPSWLLPCYTFLCISSYTSLDLVYKKKNFQNPSGVFFGNAHVSRDQ